MSTTASAAPDTRPGRGPEARGVSVPALVATALLRHDLPDSTPEERDAAARYVDDCVSSMPDFTRFGVRVAGTAVYVALSALGRAPYRTLTEERRAELAARLISVPLPILGEFGRLTRGLGLVGVHENRPLLHKQRNQVNEGREGVER